MLIYRKSGKILNFYYVKVQLCTNHYFSMSAIISFLAPSLNIESEIRGPCRKYSKIYNVYFICPHVRHFGPLFTSYLHIKYKKKTVHRREEIETDRQRKDIYIFMIVLFFVIIKKKVISNVIRFTIESFSITISKINDKNVMSWVIE